MLLNAIQSGFDTSEIIICLLSALVVIFLTMPVHEWAHGFVSNKLGDPTPRYQGRLTLNPLAHIDPMGALGILLFGIGWAKPVGVNARYYKNPKWGMALVAAAGPLSNLILAFISLFLSNLIWNIALSTDMINSLDSFNTVMLIMLFFYFVAQINVSLAVFNLIPIPPFDGSRILFTFLPKKYYFMIMRYEQYIFIGMLMVLCLGVFDEPLQLATANIMSSINNFAELPFELLLN